MGHALGDLTDEQWRSPSRCDGWSVQDVVAHLIGTNTFWAASIEAGVMGSPTRYLASFDPVATPAQMVEPMRSMTAADTLQQFLDTNNVLCAVIESLNDCDWSKVAESPPGHVPIRLVAHHALWDSWVHERDILVPLGIAPAEEGDELISCLRYVAALGPALGLSAESGRSGALLIEATEPDARVVVDVNTTVHVHDGPAPSGATRLRGRAVDLIDMLSIRAPLDPPVSEQDRWLFSGLATVFDAAIDAA